MMGKRNYHNTIIVCTIFVITLGQIPSNGFAEGRSNSIIKHEKNITILSDGDVYDCIDIYKQPAFNHPLLKDHLIQMKPSFSADNFEGRNRDDGLLQSWHEGEQCPDGTIPVIRTKFPPKRRGDYKSSTFTTNITNLDQNSTLAASVHEYATADVYGGFYGAKARMNVWKPHVSNPGEFSLAQVWLVAGKGNDLNTIEAGWQIRFGDDFPKFFIYWTSDNYGKTGCYNLDCHGFVQTAKVAKIGGKVRPVSIYNGEQYGITLIIRKDAQSGNWWLNVQDQDIGYWPGSIFTALAEKATEIDFGGEIVNKKPDGKHTYTQMGSGHFTFEGYRKAAYFSNLEINDNGGTSGTFKDPDVLKTFVTNTHCYDLQVVQDRGTEFGVQFFYGGPGRSFDCP